MLSRFIPVLLGSGLLVSVAVAQEQNAEPEPAEAPREWKGPLPMENGRPFQDIFLHLPAEKPELVAPNQAEWNAQLDLHNNLLIPKSNGSVVQEDFETQRLNLSYRRGVSQRLEVGIGSQLEARNGGILDSPIAAYHHLFGFGGNDRDNPEGRDSRPKGRSILSFQDANGNRVNEGSAFGLGDTTLWLKTPLKTGKLEASARFALKLPTGSGSKILGSGGFDAGVALDARYQFAKKWALHGNLGVSKYGQADVPNAKGSGYGGGLGIEWQRSHSQSFIAQFDMASRAVTTGNTFADRTPAIVSVGYIRQINPNRQFWVSFSENGDYQNYSTPILGSIAPDFSLSFGYRWTR